MQKGWVKLHRKIQDHWIYQEKRQFSRYEAWLDLIMMANHKDNKTLVDGELIAIEKGSFITSKRELGRRWDWSNSKVDKFLGLLKSDDMIDYKSDTKKTVITIGKYEVYHDSDKEKRHENETETKQKHIENESETNKQECKEFKALKALKNLSSSSSAQQENPMIDLELKSVIDFYEQQSFGMITPHVADKMAEWIADTSKELVIHAMKLAIESGAIKWSYAEGILRNWTTRKLTTVEQVEAFELQRKQQKATQQRSTSIKAIREEIVPEWFASRRPKQTAANNTVPIDFDVEAERRKLMQELGIQEN
ncbi:DnaD domain protein [Mammaliicoccus sciuri]